MEDLQSELSQAVVKFGNTNQDDDLLAILNLINRFRKTTSNFSVADFKKLAELVISLPKSDVYIRRMYGDCSACEKLIKEEPNSPDGCMAGIISPLGTSGWGFSPINLCSDCFSSKDQEEAMAKLLAINPSGSRFISRFNPRHTVAEVILMSLCPPLTKMKPKDATKRISLISEQKTLTLDDRSFLELMYLSKVLHHSYYIELVDKPSDDMS
jgi:hypothetical protein